MSRLRFEKCSYYWWQLLGDRRFTVGSVGDLSDMISGNHAWRSRIQDRRHDEFGAFCAQIRILVYIEDFDLRNGPIVELLSIMVV
jgi:hypothetical protein